MRSWTPTFALPQFEPSPDTELGRAVQHLNARLSATDSLSNSSPANLWRQPALSKALDRQAHQQFLGTLSRADLADLQSEMLPGASSWLEAPPCKAQGLTMNPPEFVTELQRRLLMRLYDQDTWCPLCDGVLDTAARQCSAGGDRTRRHHAARNLVGQLAQEAGLRPELEKPGLLPPSPDEPDGAARRPADVYLPSCFQGAPAALDLAVSSPQRLEALLLAKDGIGVAAAAYEQSKRSSLNTEDSCKAQGLSFVPMVAEPSGGWGPCGFQTLQRLARAAEARRGLPRGSLLSLWLQRLCISIRRADARAVLRREPEAVGVPVPDMDV